MNELTLWEVTQVSKIQPEPTFHNTARKHGRFTVWVNWDKFSLIMLKHCL